MSFHCPFHARAALAAAALSACWLLTPGSARAQLAQQAAVGDGDGARAEAPRSEAPRSEAAAKPGQAPTAGAAGNAGVQANPAQKSIAARAVDKVKDVF